MKVDDEPLILSPAYDHGLGDDDIMHALRNHVHAVPGTRGMTLYIGPGPSGELLEIGLAEKYGTVCIVHAMPARPQYLPRGGDER